MFAMDSRWSMFNWKSPPSENSCPNKIDSSTGAELSIDAVKLATSVSSDTDPLMVTLGSLVTPSLSELPVSLLSEA